MIIEKFHIPLDNGEIMASKLSPEEKSIWKSEEDLFYLEVSSKDGDVAHVIKMTLKRETVQDIQNALDRILK